MRAQSWFLVVLGLFTAGRGHAQVPEEQIEVTVKGERSPPEGQTVELESARYTTSADALAELPGVAAVRRGAAAPEPVLRGLGSERVVTQIGHLPVYGACPGRMDPPLSYVRPYLAPTLRLSLGMPSVTDGPGGTAGRIVVDTDLRHDPAERALGAELAASYHPSRAGYGGSARVQGSADTVDVALGGEGQKLHDYESASGIVVPASQTEMGASLRAGVTPAPGHRVWNTLAYVRHQDVDYPALPMDLDWTDAWIYDAGYRVAVDDPNLMSARVGFGTARISHAMSNRHKPNRAMLEAATASESRSLAGVASLTWRLAERAALETGVDTTRLERDALRTRRMVATDRMATDHLWPDARQWTSGFFAELRWAAAGPLFVRLGGRADYVHSSALGAADPGLGGAPIHASYARFYGARVADVVAQEIAGAGNLVVRYELAPEIETELGAGVATRPAGLTERYFAFAPAPGGFMVGNPTLRAEQKRSLVWSASWRMPAMDLDVGIHASQIRDYVLTTTIAQQDVNGDGVVDRVRGFQNVDAVLMGGEVAAEPRLTSFLSLPTSFAVVQGQNTTLDRPLPEIPPWVLASALRVSLGRSYPWWGQVGGRYVAEQDRIDVAFGENATPAHFTVHVRGGVRFFEGWDLEAAVENVLNEDYHDHLTRESAFTVGALTQGGEIPAEGRSLHLGIRAQL
jgi:iron complex outermembrane receptor protein